MYAGSCLGAVRRQDRPAHRGCGIADQEGDRLRRDRVSHHLGREGGPVGGVSSGCGATAFTRISCVRGSISKCGSGEVTQRLLAPAGRHHRAAGGGEDRRHRVTTRTGGAGHDRHLCAHDVNRPRSAAVTCSPNRCTFGAHHEFLPISPAQPGSLPGVMSFSVTRRSTGPGCYHQVRGHHQIVVIRRTGTTQDGMGSRRREDEGAAGPRVRARLTARALAWYRGRRCPDWVTGAGGVGRGDQGRTVTVAPAVPRLIGRGDLVAALDRAVTRKVTIISAPAGSGKTSLLRAWAGRPGSRPD
jgi:hypothetical protein